MYQRILVATDGSELSSKAVQSAIELAALTGATLIALNVMPRYPRSYMEGALPVDAANVKQIEAQWTATARQQPGIARTPWPRGRPAAWQ